MSENIAKDIRSFVSFALAMKPQVIFHRRADARGPELSITFSAEDGNENYIEDFEPLMTRYIALKSYLDAIINSGKSIADCSPTINFQPNVHYRMIRLTQGDFEIAKEAATRLRKIQESRETGDQHTAREQYDKLREYLQSQRDAMVGELRNVRLSNATASYGAGRLSVDGDCTGAVIFVIAEAIICVPAK